VAGHRLVLGAAVAAITGSQAVAQSAPDEVVVSTNRLEETLPEELSKYGMRLETVTRADVRNGSYVDVTQSLQALAPGLYLQPKNGPFDYSDISLQGSRTGDVLWLVDGVRINNRLYSGTPPLDTVPSSVVERLEVLEGGQSLFYGTGAVAGAVNIVTKSFSDKPEGAVSLALDTNNSRHADAFFSDAFGRHHLVLYGSSDDSDGFRAFRRSDYQPSATDRDRGYDVKSFGAKYAFDFTESLRASATWQHTDADLDFAQPYRVAHNENSREEDLATAKLDYALSDNVGLYLKGYYHWWHTDYDTTYNDLTNPGATEVLYDNAFWGFDDRGVNALARFSFTKGVDYFVGYDLQRYGGRDEVLFIAPTKEQTQAVFAQVRTTPDLIPNAHFAAGVRYNDPDVGQSATVWNLSGQYDISSTLFVRGAVGTNFRLPSAEELFADDPQDERGNPNLKPERSRSLNLSIGGTIGEGPQRLHWELIGFARNIDDLIDYDAFDEDTGQSVFGNVAGTVRVRGGEAVLEGSFSDAFSTNLSFTRNRARTDGGDQITRIPEQLLKARFDYHPAGLPFGAALAVNYTGHVFTTVGPDRVQYGNYAVVDVSGRYFLDSEHRHRLNLSLQNALDKEYGRPQRGCLDVSTDGAYDCSSPYAYVNLGQPRTLWGSYTYAF
jgi:vitamin B12 transporter